MSSNENGSTSRAGPGVPEGEAGCRTRQRHVSIGLDSPSPHPTLQSPHAQRAERQVVMSTRAASRSRRRTKLRTIEGYADAVSYDLDRLVGVCDLIAELADSSSAVVKAASVARTFRWFHDELETVLDGARTIASDARPPQKPPADRGKMHLVRR